MRKLIDVTYKTNNGNCYPVELSYKQILSKDVTHDYNAITSLCRNGCKNYNYSGGCPPRAPNFSSIKEDYLHSVVLCATFYSKYKPQKVMESKSIYIHYRFQDIILSNLLTKLGYKVLEKSKQNVIFLNNGYCIGCGRKKCNFKSGSNYCRFPKKRTYSLEATGINVEETLKKQFGINLQWYNHNNYKEVEYMTKAIGFFFEHRKAQEEVSEIIYDSLKELLVI